MIIRESCGKFRVLYRGDIELCSGLLGGLRKLAILVFFLEVPFRS